MICFDVYKNCTLAARFIYGVSPTYFGAAGEELADLLQHTPVVYNLWTGESVAEQPLAGIDWWASQLLGAPLRRAGFVLSVSTATAPIALSA